VVQDAEREPIVLRLRATRLVPADVGGIQGDRHRAKAYVETADGASVLVGLEYPLAEGRVSLPTGDSGLQREADGVQYVLMQRFGKVLVEDSRGDNRCEARFSGKGGLHVGGEFRPDVVVRPQLGDAGDVGTFLGLQPGRGMNGPNAVTL